MRSDKSCKLCLTLVAIGLAACGRIHFDTHSDAGVDTGSALDALLDAPDDAAAACNPITCTGTASSTSINGRCLTTCGDLVGWDAAEVRCIAWGGHLAAIRDQQDQDALMSIWTNVSWIGYQQADGQPTPSAGWSWVDGTPNTYDNFIAPEPQDSDSVENNAEQCAHVNFSGPWADQNCAVTRAFACSR